jgi:hypothetical protein
MGRPPKASPEVLAWVAEELLALEPRTEPYRKRRRELANFVGCTERGLELMVERFQKQKAEACETTSADQPSVSEGLASSNVKDSTASSAKRA